MADILNLLCGARSVDAPVGWRDGRAVTYAQFEERVQEWCGFLLGLSGMCFALYFSDSVEFAAALFGAWHAGKVIYLPSDVLPATCDSLRSAVDGYLGEFPPQYTPLTATDAVQRTAAPTLSPLQPDFAGLVVFTSGSTGTPQAIPKKLSQLSTEVATLEALFGEKADKAEVVATVSHQHIYGLLFKVLWPLAAGRAIHARSLTYPEQLVALTASRECVLVSSPAHLKRLPESPAWTEATHRVRIAFSSGGPLAHDVAQMTAARLGAAPVEVYGSSETGGIAWRQRGDHADVPWIPMPGVEARIASDGDVLEIRSPHLPEGCWFRTSDRARVNDDGGLAILGRVDRIVKIEEKRISLDLIEARLLQSALVREARVLVIDGARQRIVAFVVLSDTGHAELDTIGKLALNTRLREHLADAVERIALPRSWRYLDALPVNALGKTTQAELAALLDEEKPAARPTRPFTFSATKESQRAVFDMSAPRDLLYFEGHFPQTPILPGVAQLNWAVGLARECFGLPPCFLGVNTLKFQRVLRPEERFTLELQHDAVKHSVTFRYFSPAGMHSSGKLLFGAANV